MTTLNHKMPLWIVAGMAAGLFLACPAPPPSLPKYSNRAVVSDSSGCGPLSLPAQVIAKHSDVANKVLLIRSMNVVNPGSCPESPAPNPTWKWSFPSIVKRALSVVNIPQNQAEQKVQAWIADLNLEGDEVFQRFILAYPGWNTSGALDKAPLRLLAIVNRLDLARLTPSAGNAGTLEGAEIRFVYAGIESPTDTAYMSMIVEFVLPGLSKQQFKKMAGDWARLAAVTTAYPDRLAAVLERYLALSKTVRLRATGNGGGGGWYFREFAFDSTAGIRMVNLAQQPDASLTCQGPSSPIAGFITGHESAISNAVHSFEGTSLATDHVLIAGATNSVLTLDPAVLPDNVQREQVRFGLSISSCNGCHGREVMRIEEGPVSPFDQIKYRSCKAESGLSSFLTGSTDGEPGTGSTCITPPLACMQPPQTRNYNDLLRRHLFLYGVQSLKANDPDSKWAETLKATGLTTAQVH